MKRPKTRVEEVRLARGLTKAELARRSGMPPQTLQRIEDGSTKSLTPSARKMLAPVLRVREDELLVPIGFPIQPLAGEEPPVNDLIFQTCQDILAELRAIRQLLSDRGD